jgi:hypothetical protein
MQTHQFTSHNFRTIGYKFHVRRLQWGRLGTARKVHFGGEKEEEVRIQQSKTKFKISPLLNTL